MKMKQEEKLRTGKRTRVPCPAASRAGCPHCRRRKYATVMVSDAFQLTIVFTIVPVIPFAALEASLRFGVAGTVTTLALSYLGYPAAFGALMWVDLSRKVKTHGQASSPRARP